MTKRLFFIAILVLFNYVALEGIAYAFYLVKYGAYSPTNLASQRADILASADKGPAFAPGGTVRDQVVATEITHPYVGYITEGRSRKPDCDGDGYECFTRLSTALDEPVPKRADGKFIVGVFGGSVAVGTINASSPEIYARALSAALPKIGHKTVEVVGLAAGGYRQPQQLLMLNYMLSRGAEFDLLINLDGFNEIAIPSSEYKRSGLHPSFPRSWEFRIGRENSPEFMDVYARKSALDASLQKAARFANRPVVKYSPLSNLIWKLHSGSVQNQQAMLVTELQNLKSESRPREFMVEELGPEWPFTDWGEFNQHSIERWMRSSYLMHAVATAHGAKYFHFLQPNQYVAGSKVLTAREQQIAILKGQGYGERYRLAYPMLQEQAAWLLDNDVAYTDLSQVFAAESGDIYIDNCCHVNERGSDLIVMAMAKTIGAAW